MREVAVHVKRVFDIFAAWCLRWLQVGHAGVGEEQKRSGGSQAAVRWGHAREP